MRDHGVFAFSDIIKAMKNISINNQLGSVHLGIVAVVVVVLVGAVGFLFWNNILNHGNQTQSQNKSSHGIPSNSEAASNENIELMNKATEFLDSKYCDQIHGSINYTNPNTQKQQGKWVSGVSIITPAMTESEAKENCRNHVKELIDQNNYEHKVCIDDSVSHYVFNGAIWPCPEN